MTRFLPAHSFTFKLQMIHIKSIKLVVLCLEINGRNTKKQHEIGSSDPTTCLF